MNVIVDLPAVRPGRFAGGLDAADLAGPVGELRAELRGARAEQLADGVRLVLRLDVRAIARLADLVRAEADLLPFFGFRLDLLTETQEEAMTFGKQDRFVIVVPAADA